MYQKVYPDDCTLCKHATCQIGEEPCSSCIDNALNKNETKNNKWEAYDNAT